MARLVQTSLSHLIVFAAAALEDGCDRVNTLNFEEMVDSLITGTTPYLPVRPSFGLTNLTFRVVTSEAHPRNTRPSHHLPPLDFP